MTTPPTQTGGCQCGAVRFMIEGDLGDASICHCRMCQKAFGNFYAPLVALGQGALTWTRGTAHRFKSSNYVERGFCKDCGTPLFYEAPDGIALAVGAFDNPASIEPVIQFGSEGKLPYVDGLQSLPNRHTIDDIVAAPFLHDLKNFQHPDHDTDTWPPERA